VDEAKPFKIPIREVWEAFTHLRPGDEGGRQVAPGDRGRARRISHEWVEGH
jgi:hypothetical protein